MNINMLMQQAKKMQNDMEKAKEEVSKKTFTAKQPLVEVEVNGDKAGNKGTGTLTNQTTATVPGAGEGLETGNITASPAVWSSGKASITLTTTTSFQIEYPYWACQVWCVNFLKKFVKSDVIF